VWRLQDEAESDTSDALRRHTGRWTRRRYADWLGASSPLVCPASRQTALTGPLPARRPAPALSCSADHAHPTRIWTVRHIDRGLCLQSLASAQCSVGNCARLCAGFIHAMVEYMLDMTRPAKEPYSVSFTFPDGAPDPGMTNLAKHLGVRCAGANSICIVVSVALPVSSGLSVFGVPASPASPALCRFSGPRLSCHLPLLTDTGPLHSVRVSLRRWFRGGGVVPPVFEFRRTAWMLFSARDGRGASLSVWLSTGSPKLGPRSSLATCNTAHIGVLVDVALAVCGQRCRWSPTSLAFPRESRRMAQRCDQPVDK